MSVKDWLKRLLKKEKPLPVAEPLEEEPKGGTYTEDVRRIRKIHQALDEEDAHRTTGDLEAELAAVNALRDRTLSMKAEWFPDLLDEDGQG